MNKRELKNLIKHVINEIKTNDPIKGLDPEELWSNVGSNSETQPIGHEWAKLANAFVSVLQEVNEFENLYATDMKTEKPANIEQTKTDLLAVLDILRKVKPTIMTLSSIQSKSYYS